MNYKTRINAFRENLVKLGADAALITSQSNRFYLSGFTGSAGQILITLENEFLFVDSRYTVQANLEATDYEILAYDGNYYNNLRNKLNNINYLAFEDKEISLFSYKKIEEKLSGINLMPLGDTLIEQRQEKSEEEIKTIHEAVRLADEAFFNIAQKIKVGMTEMESALIIEDYMRKEGALKPSFDTICASGVRSALPHGVASQKKIQKGDFVVFDYGCILDGYCSDITRTIVLGNASDRQKEIYNIVLYAQSRAIHSIVPNMRAKELDNVARKIISEFGYADNFGHSLGHGVGIDVHEMPTVGSNSEDIIKNGSVITIEPGIYIEGFGGVRIEDMVYVTGDGYTILTGANKELIEI